MIICEFFITHSVKPPEKDRCWMAKIEPLRRSYEIPGSLIHFENPTGFSCGRVPNTFADPHEAPQTATERGKCCIRPTFV
jgi:hypothetical protein